MSSYYDIDTQKRDSLKVLSVITNLLNLEKRIDNKRLLSTVQKTLGDYYVRYDGHKASHYFGKAKSAIDSSIYFNPLKYRIEVDEARCQEQLGQYQKAIDILHKSKSNFHYGNEIINKLNYTFFLSEFHGKLRQHDSANYFLKEMWKLEHEQRFTERNRAISELEVRLDTSEKEKENLILQKDKINNRNIVVGLGGV